MSDIKVWSEGKRLFLDIEYLEIRPNFIDLTHDITFHRSIRDDVYIETTDGNFYLLNASDPKLVCLISESRINRISGKEE